MDEFTVNEEADLHFNVCVSIEGAEIIEQPFTVEFDLCKFDGKQNRFLANTLLGAVFCC